MATHQRDEVPLSRDDLGWLRLDRRYIAWLAEGAPLDVPVPAEVLAWCEQSAAELIEVLRAADPDEPIWTWAQDKRVAYSSEAREMAATSRTSDWCAPKHSASFRITVAGTGRQNLFDSPSAYQVDWCHSAQRGA